VTTDPGRRSRPSGGTAAHPTDDSTADGAAEDRAADDRIADAPPSGAPASGSSSPRPRRPWPLRRPRPLSRKAALVAGAGTVALAVLAGAGNVLLAQTARRHIVNAAVCRLSPVGRVSAHLSGSLAGLRLLTGDVGTVRISAEDVRRDGTSLSVAAELRGVTTKGHSSGGSATATIGYDQLAKRLGGGIAGLRPGPDGSGGLTLTGTLAGIPLPVTVRTRITTGAQQLTVAPTGIVVFGQDFPVDRLSASPQTSALAGRLAPRTVEVPQLPAGVRLTGASAGAGGLRLTLAISGSAITRPSRGCSR
jgi:hypothetical protein